MSRSMIFNDLGSLSFALEKGSQFRDRMLIGLHILCRDCSATGRLALLGCDSQVPGLSKAMQS